MPAGDRKLAMCGIVACIGEGHVAPTLLEALARVEYRGYDSAGLATLSGGKVIVRKDVGKVSEIAEKTDAASLPGSVGVAHTRWATHGAITPENAHPHLSCDGGVAVVHNGVISNFQELKRGLENRGHLFRSGTDSEVVAHLLEEEYLVNGDPVAAIAGVARRLAGQYALALMFRDRPDLLLGIRCDAPLIVGVSDGRNFLASDVLAFTHHTDRVLFLENLEVAVLRREGVKILTLEGIPVRRDETQIARELNTPARLEYAHHTLQEIHEQVTSVARAMRQDPEKLSVVAGLLGKAGSVVLTAAGSSYHAALTMKGRLNRDAGVRCEAILAGEFEQSSNLIDGETVVLALSQSGETADVLHAVKTAKTRGARILSVVNAPNTSLVRMSDESIPLNCGPEHGVAATKSFTAQVMVLNMIVDAMVGRNTVGDPEAVSLAVRESLGAEEMARSLVPRYAQKNDFYFIARGSHYPIAVEGALKMKELSYLHAEGMAASELKHGTLALIERGTPVVVINPEGEGNRETLSSAQELRARGAEIIGISDSPNEVYHRLVTIPSAPPSILPIVEVIPLQFLAYWMALARSNNPDYPRNLAKSVTVR